MYFCKQLKKSFKKKIENINFNLNISFMFYDKKFSIRKKFLSINTF
jgi:hypothetical protein